MGENEAFGAAAVRRSERLTLILGAVGAVAGAWQWGWRGGAGVAVGAVLSWVNFRWLKGGVHALTAATVASQAGAPPARVRRGAYLKFFGRFGLLLGVIYVMLTTSWFPAAAVLAGLLAAAAGVILALLYELLAGGVREVRGGSR